MRIRNDRNSAMVTWPCSMKVQWKSLVWVVDQTKWKWKFHTFPYGVLVGLVSLRPRSESLLCYYLVTFGLSGKLRRNYVRSCWGSSLGRKGKYPEFLPASRVPSLKLPPTFRPGHKDSISTPNCWRELWLSDMDTLKLFLFSTGLKSGVCQGHFFMHIIIYKKWGNGRKFTSEEMEFTKREEMEEKLFCGILPGLCIC